MEHKKEKEHKIIILSKHLITRNRIGHTHRFWIIIDGIKTNYSINSIGIIKNEISGIEIIPDMGARYYRISLNINKNRIKLLYHRLLACMFIQIPRSYRRKGYTQQSLEVNHKDGNKHNNSLNNLEWMTPRENTVHAFENGLAEISRGEQSHLAKITEETAIQICELLMESKSTQEIADELGVSKKTVQHIKSGECWKLISKNYSFPKLGNSIPYKYTDETIEQICEDLEKKRYTDEYIAKQYGTSIGFVNDIKNHKRRTDISSKYDF